MNDRQRLENFLSLIAGVEQKKDVPARPREAATNLEHETEIGSRLTLFQELHESFEAEEAERAREAISDTRWLFGGFPGLNAQLKDFLSEPDFDDFFFELSGMGSISEPDVIEQMQNKVIELGFGDKSSAGVMTSVLLAGLFPGEFTDYRKSRSDQFAEYFELDASSNSGGYGEKITWSADMARGFVDRYPVRDYFDTDHPVWLVGGLSQVYRYRSKDKGSHSVDFDTGVWIISPSKNAEHWDGFVEHDHIAIGWNSAGDLRNYVDENGNFQRQKLKENLEEDRPERNSEHPARQLQDFYENISEGDYIIARDGVSEIRGWGRVESSEYSHRPELDREWGYNVKPVDWLAIGRWTWEGTDELEQFGSYSLVEKSPGDSLEKFEDLAEGLESSVNVPVFEVPNGGNGNGNDNDNDGSTVTEPMIDHEELKRLLERDPNLVLQGPPGTGKTYEAKRFAAKQAGFDITSDDWRDELEKYQFSELEGDPDALESKDVVWEIVQLHPEYAYEDFVRGMATQGGEGIEFAPEDQTFVKMAELARIRQEAADNGETKPTILILDEINRANLPSLLGELIYALEADKRGDKVRLQYEAPDENDEEWLDSDDALEVPENLWVLGTMNTADRSIAMVDYAIRRRFRFMEMQPNDNGALQDYYEDTSRSGERVAEALEAINDAIDDSVRDRYGVGHSYLMVEPEKVDDWEQAIRDRLQYEVAPLLKEYALEGHLEAGMDRNDVVEEAKETLNLDSEAADE
jgi:MoxR-like ATPase